MTFLKKNICLVVGLLHTLLKLCPDNTRSYQSNTAFLAKTSCHLVPPERIKIPGNSQNILSQKKKIEVLGNPDARFLLLLLETRSNFPFHFAEVKLSLEILHSHWLSWKTKVEILLTSKTGYLLFFSDAYLLIL